MKTRLLAIACLGLLVGCSSTPSSRFSEKQALASSWPAEVQDKVRAGKVEPGFTKEQVYVALGRADRITTRQTNEGSFEVWHYVTSRPSIGIGIGGGGGSMFGGASVGTSGRSDLKCSVVFKGDLVVSVDNTTRS